jgi:hypothetical protein
MRWANVTGTESAIPRNTPSVSRHLGPIQIGHLSDASQECSCLTESEVFSFCKHKFMSKHSCFSALLKKPKQVAGIVNKKDLFRNKFVLTEWKILFIHFIFMLFIQFREQNGMTLKRVTASVSCFV